MAKWDQRCMMWDSWGGKTFIYNLQLTYLSVCISSKTDQTKVQYICQSWQYSLETFCSLHVTPSLLVWEERGVAVGAGGAGAVPLRQLPHHLDGGGQVSLSWGVCERRRTDGGWTDKVICRGCSAPILNLTKAGFDPRNIFNQLMQDGPLTWRRYIIFDNRTISSLLYEAGNISTNDVFPDSPNSASHILPNYARHTYMQHGPTSTIYK